MKDIIYVSGIEGLAYVLLEKLESWLRRQVSDIFSIAGEEVIGAYDLMTFNDQRVAEMRAKETRSACHKYPHTLSIRSAILQLARALKATWLSRRIPDMNSEPLNCGHKQDVPRKLDSIIEGRPETRHLCLSVPQTC